MKLNYKKLPLTLLVLLIIVMNSLICGCVATMLYLELRTYGLNVLETFCISMLVSMLSYGYITHNHKIRSFIKQEL
jgi:uncharacterized membrane protein YjjP (DUF1212 family)